MTRPPRPRLNSEAVARLDERMNAVEESSKEHDGNYGKLLGAVSSLESDIAVIKSMLETSDSERPKARGLSAGAQAGLVTALVTIAQVCAELVKALLHLH